VRFPDALPESERRARTRGGESKVERIERLLGSAPEFMGISTGAVDYCRRTMRFKLGLTENEPSERGSFYTLSPKGAAELRTRVAVALKNDGGDDA
jgi:hypothetical protein